MEPHETFPPVGDPPAGGNPPPNTGIRARDVASVALIVSGAAGLLACLYVLHPLAAAAVVSVAVIAGGAYIGMDDQEAS